MAGGVFGGGNGTIEAPYLIEDVDDLNMVRGFPTSHFKLMSNINLGVPPYNSQSGWSPIDGFKGSLDGNGKKIYNLFINRPAEDKVGLFSSFDLQNNAATEKVHIKDLVLENVNVSGNNYVGAVVGYVHTYYDTNRNSDGQELFSGIAVSGKISGAKLIGGIAGRFYQAFNSNGQFRYLVACNCYSSATIAPLEGGDYVGQLIGATADVGGTPGGAKSIFVFRNCVGTGALRPRGEFVPAHVGTLAYTSNTTFDKCFIDGDRWKCELGSKNTLLQMLTTDELKKTETTKDLVTVREDGVPYWSLDEGRYPELWCNSGDYLFVFGEGRYYTYDAKSEQWVKQYTVEPSIHQAVVSGMRHLDYVPSKAWSFFKSMADPYVVNIMDKANTEELKTASLSLVKNSFNSDSNRTVFRKTVNFNANGGILAAINI